MVNESKLKDETEDPNQKQPVTNEGHDVTAIVEDALKLATDEDCNEFRNIDIETEQVTSTGTHGPNTNKNDNGVSSSSSFQPDDSAAKEPTGHEEKGKGDTIRDVNDGDDKDGKRGGGGGSGSGTTGKKLPISHHDDQMWVMNIKKGTRASEVNKAFIHFGSIKSCKIVAKANEFFGVVRFNEVSSLEKCLKSDEKITLKGNVLTVNRYNQSVKKNKGTTKSEVRSSTKGTGTKGKGEAKKDTHRDHRDSNNKNSSSGTSSKKESDGKKSDPKRDTTKSDSKRDTTRSDPKRDTIKSDPKRSSGKKEETKKSSDGKDLKASSRQDSDRDRVRDRKESSADRKDRASRSVRSPLRSRRYIPRSDPLTLRQIEQEKRDRLLRDRERRRDEMERHRAFLLLEREQDKLRMERDKLEREKAEFIRLERERTRQERERMERERDELRRLDSITRVAARSLAPVVSDYDHLRGGPSSLLGQSASLAQASAQVIPGKRYDSREDPFWSDRDRKRTSLEAVGVNVGVGQTAIGSRIPYEATTAFDDRDRGFSAVVQRSTIPSMGGNGSGRDSYDDVRRSGGRLSDIMATSRPGDERSSRLVAGGGGAGSGSYAGASSGASYRSSQDLRDSRDRRGNGQSSRDDRRTNGSSGSVSVTPSGTIITDHRTALGRPSMGSIIGSSTSLSGAAGVYSSASLLGTSHSMGQIPLSSLSGTMTSSDRTSYSHSLARRY